MHMQTAESPRVTLDPEISLLVIVGQRVRSLRALRGISRRILAERSEVSERHLAQIEGGTGNVSIRLLDQIAAALGVVPGELLSPSTDTTPEATLLGELVAALTLEQQRQAIELIRSEIMSGSTTSPFVTLIGLRGAGKTTLGQQLADRYQLPFLRITDLIEQRAGMAMSEIHSLSGQIGYRRYEEQAVAGVFSEHSRGVIEAGGSIVANPPAFNALLSQSFVVWVQTTPEKHMGRVVEQGDLRPIEGRSDAMDDLLSMLQERTPLYSQAHARLDTSNTTVDDSLAALSALTKSRLE